MPSNAIVYIIDDDDAARDSLEFLIKSARIGVQTFESAMAFLKALPTLKPGCIVTDVRMPEISGIDLLRRLREMGIAMPVIVITGHGDIQLAVEAMKIGAIDFIEKPFDDELLLGTVKSALARRDIENRQDAEKVELQERLMSLSNREREVLEGLIAGNPNKVIAADLEISPRTVEIYRANVMTKMKAASLSELVRLALTCGLLTPSKSE